MALMVIAAAAALATSPCAALEGPHPGDVRVVRASAISPDPVWKPDSRERGYRAQDVRVPLCRVEGVIEGTIGFELWMPIAWNGRLLGAGVGGDAGIFNYLDMSLRVGEGFATVTTDSGHKASEPHWMTGAKARADYEHRAVHLTAQAAKFLVARHYGRGPDRSYFTGCSGGGRQGLKEMQNYPGDYDGILSGAPGPYMPLISVRMMWFSLMQKHNPSAALTDADWALYEAKATAACDAQDGVADGVVENPLACRFRPRALLCTTGQGDGCLTAPKLAMLETIIAPMRDERGRAMDGGLLPGVRTRPGPPSPLLRAMWGDAVYGDPHWNEDSFQRTADLAKVNRAMPELRTDRVEIARFIARGGKAIIYQGWADPSVIAGPTLGYYRRLAKAQGGVARLSDHVRLFMAPGVYHCRGGPGADQFGASGQSSTPGDATRDMLWALIDWVEKGRAPQMVIAAKPGAFTRKLCRFPQSARYAGQGDTSDAASFACVDDPALKRAR